MRILIIAAIALLPLTGFSKAKPTPKPTPVVQTVDYNAIIDEAEQAVADLPNKLNNALDRATETQVELNGVSASLTSAVNKTIELQKQINDETDLFNKTREELNAQIKETEVWKAKHAACLKKLNFWREIAASIIGLITLYGGFLALKAYGKTTFF